MKKRAIPSPPADAAIDRRAFDSALKENLEILMGQRGGKVDTLPSTATTAQIIAKINELIGRLQ